MSTVTGIVLICPLREPNVKKLNDVLREATAPVCHSLGGDLTEAQASSFVFWTGGNKSPQLEIYSAGLNGWQDAIDAFVAAFKELTWDDPDQVVLIINSEHSERYDVLFPRNSSR